MADSSKSTDTGLDNNEIIETMKLLDEGRAKIVLSEKYRDVTLVLGITGAGKTTFVQWLAGDDSKLISVLEEGTDDDYIIEDGNRIGNSTIESKTKFPELVVSADTDTPYYDCPGFIDTRGIGNDITSTYFIKVVAEHAKSVKMIFVIDYPSVRKTGNRDVFTNLLKHSTEVMKDVDKFKGGIALVASKVENKIVKNKDGTFEVLSDAKMITPIAFFLRSVKDDLAKTSTEGDLKLIKFIDAVLQSDDGGESYPKIGLFRRPNTDGPLSEIKLLQEGKKKIVAMVNKLKYVPVEASDFGYTISDKSKNNINGLITEINDRVWNEVDSIAKNVKKYYDGIVGKMSVKIKSFVTAKDDEANLVEAQTFATKLNLSSKKMSELVAQVTTNSTSIKELHKKLNSTLNSLEIATCQANLATIANQASYFDFLQNVSDSPLPTRQWASLLQGIVDSLSNSKQAIKTDVNVLVESVANQVNSTVIEIGTELWKAKLNQIKSRDIQQLPAQLDQDFAIMQNMTLELNKANNAEQLASTISKNVHLLDLENDLIKSKTLSIFTRSKYLSYLQALSDHPLHTWSLNWIVPFNQTAKSFNDTSKWYRFLSSLYSSLGEYEFQHDPSRYNVANVADWAAKDGQAKPQGIQISGENIAQFLDKLKPYEIEEYDAIKSLQIADWQLNELNQVLSLTLKHSAFDRDCSEEGKVVITGDYVKLSNLIQSGNRLGDLCPNKPKLSSLNIFASKSMFIDADLNGVGNKFKLTIAAPNWESIGSKRTLTLDGSVGEVQSKANTGKKPGNPGDAGKPGKAGGPAGSFLGIGQQFVNGNGLTVSANGGAGGGGQEGGDGQTGVAGTDIEKPSSGCVLTGDYKKVGSSTVRASETSPIFRSQYLISGTKGTAGGAGGDGGTGGTGGLAGAINFDANSAMLSSSSRGNNGTAGHGGKGAEGGKDGNDMRADCDTRYLLAFPISTYLYSWGAVQVNTKGPTGKNGVDGNNHENTPQPEAAVVIERPADRINDFKKYLRQNLVGVNGRFKRASILEYLDQLDESVLAKEAYDTLGFAGELEGLEQQFRSLTNRQDLAHFYGSLLGRIAKYAKSPKATEKSDQHKKVFNYLYAAVLGKLYNLNAGSETNLIIDVEGYLNYVKENMKALNDIRQKKNEHEIVQKHKQQYQDNIEQQIKEARKFIETEVTPEFDKISKKIDEQIEQLIKETEELAKKEKENQKELIKKREQLQNQMALRALFSGIKVASQVATFFGPYGMAIGTGMGALDSLAEGFLLDDQTSEGKEFKLPAGITANMKLLETDLKAYNDQKVKDLKTKIDEIGKEMKPAPELDESREKIQKILVDLLNENAEHPGLVDLVDLQKIIEADKDVKKIAKEIEKELKDKKDKDEKVSEKAMAAVRRVNQIAQLSSTALEIYSKIRGDQAKIDATDDALKATEKRLKEIDEYKMSIYNKISPNLQKLVNDLREIQSKVGTKSHVALDVSNWKVQGMVKDVKLEVGKLTKGTKVEDDMARSIDKLDEAMTILTKLYDRIQSFSQQQELANFLANINSPESNKINVTDPILSTALGKVDIVIRSNIVLQQYDATVEALKQLVFPYARFYLETLSLPSVVHSNSTDIDELVTSASAALDKMKSKVVENKTKISKFDQYAHTALFDSNEPCLQAPFHVWTNGQHSNALAKLLAGEPVTLKAAVQHSDPGKDVIKFNKIEINLKSRNATNQPEINEKLKKFMVSATHLGNSYYRYGGKYYVIANEPLDIQYSFAKDANGKPNNKNNVYTKISSGDLMLSPYAMWRIQLLKLNETLSFDQLAMYKSEIDLELVGEGSYTESKAASGNDLQMERYYEEYDADSAEAENGLVEQYESQQLISAQAKKLMKCKPKLNVSNSSQIVNQSKNNEKKIDKSIRTKRSVENDVQGPLSYISQLYTQTMSSIFGSKANTVIAHPQFEYTKQHNSSTNLTQSSNSVDVHGNLLMGQLLVGLIGGKNNTITSSESYLSPEQTHSLDVERLAQRVMPALSQFNATRSNQLHNSNNQWNLDLNETSRKHN